MNKNIRQDELIKYSTKKVPSARENFDRFFHAKKIAPEQGQNEYEKLNFIVKTSKFRN